MQINAANLLIAAQQQAARPAMPQPKEFAALDFKQAAPVPKAAAAQPGTIQRPGANLDIRV